MKILISLSADPKELWETQMKLDLAFSHFNNKDDGTIEAINAEGEILDVYAPELTKIKKPYTEKNLKRLGQQSMLPGGEPVVIEQDPTNSDMRVDQVAMQTPLVPVIK